MATDFVPGKCHICGAKVRQKRNSADRIYYYCNGALEGTGCGSNINIGFDPSRELISAEEGRQQKITDDALKVKKPESSIEPEPENPETPIEPEPKSPETPIEPEPEKKGFWHDDLADDE